MLNFQSSKCVILRYYSTFKYDIPVPSEKYLRRLITWLMREVSSSNPGRIISPLISKVFFMHFSVAQEALEVNLKPQSTH